jgi:hypothetical protein
MALDRMFYNLPVKQEAAAAAAAAAAAVTSTFSPYRIPRGGLYYKCIIILCINFTM